MSVEPGNTASANPLSGETQPEEESFTGQLHKDYFALFGFRAEYAIADDQLESHYLALQRLTHPDRHAGDTRAQHLAVRYAARINEAYETLRCPVRRAAYLLQLYTGSSGHEETTAVNDSVFLTEQLQWREALEEAGGQSQVIAGLRCRAQEQLIALQERFGNTDLHGPDGQAEGAGIVQRMQFMQRFLEQLHDEEDRLLHSGHSPAGSC